MIRHSTNMVLQSLVLSGLDRPLDQTLGVRQRKEALRSGQEILPHIMSSDEMSSQQRR